ncbi:MAG: hypothetical protein J0L56_07140 [Chitinophagales bacterium]|nr:hypothetical protein [Chitinophagales bacterium]
MRGPKRDILVVVKNQYLSEQDIEQEVQCLNEMLRITETHEEFCKAHELVDRNCITNRSKKIIKAIQFSELQPFRFLINKN